MTDRYAIVTDDYYYDSSNEAIDYKHFSEYDYESFEKQIRNLTLRNIAFRAFRIVPVIVTINTIINIGL